MERMASQREYVSLRERVAYETYAALNGGDSLGFAPSRRIAEYLRWTDAALAALGLDDLDAAARRAQEAISAHDQFVARCHPNIGQVKAGLNAALTATGESEASDG